MTNNKITQLQLISIGSCYLMGTIVVSVFVSSVLGHESWLAGITGAVCFVPTLLIYRALTKKYPGKSLFEINEAVFGETAGRGVSLIYLLFFVSLCALNVLESTNFLSYFIMPKTPALYIAAFIVAVGVYCVKKGVLPLARVSTVFGIIMAAGIIFNTLVSLYDADFRYLLPLFTHRALDYVQATHVAASIPYGESIVLLMLIPKLGEKTNISRAYLAVTGFTMLTMVIIHVRETVSLGPLVSFPDLPSYEVVRMINIANSITRTESLFALVLISLTFFKTLILYYVCMSGIVQIFRLESYRRVTIMFAAFLTVYAVNAFGAASNNIYWGRNVAPFIWTFFTSLIPLGTLLFSAGKKLLPDSGRAARREAA